MYWKLLAQYLIFSAQFNLIYWIDVSFNNHI